MPKLFLTDGCLTCFEIGSTHSTCTKSLGYFSQCTAILDDYVLFPNLISPAAFSTLFSLLRVRLHPISLQQSFTYFTAVTTSTS